MTERTFQDWLKIYFSKLSGISTPWLGLEWEPPTNERKVITGLMAELIDRRMLYHTGCGVARKDMIDSSEKIRVDVTQAVKLLDWESKARPYLDSIVSACHEFQTFLEANFNPDGYGGPEEDFYMAIGELRGSVGFALVELCKMYKIPVEGNLRKMPTEDS